ncbi:MAG: MBL fold metallo-hydrolase [Myxococcales bacterium]|nr:MBL fold metallo-hydrolase [Myxococcales bacterium]MCB9649966.1 MBL fold metallo-hydrolase [Deltaproteobacteria bacterium]
MKTKAFFDPRTYTLTYVVWDESSKDAVVIDPVLDYNAIAVRVTTESAEQVAQFIEGEGLNLKMVLETHAHADHLSGSQFLKEKFGAPVGIGANIKTVQGVFKDVFNLGDGFATDGSQFDKLIEDGETFKAGSIEVTGINTPGHTPACVTYKIADALYTGDTMFMPDFGTGRCDFPAGSASDLYDSIVNKLYSLPDDTKVFVGHDYQPGGRALAYETTIGESKASNIQLKGHTSREDFVKFRTDRDKTLQPPVLLFPSVQVNVNAGVLPNKESNGRRYLKLPIGLFD